MHLPTDIRLGYFGIMTGHVGIRVAEDLGDYINWHPVFDCQGCERMSGQVDCQIFVDQANIGNLLQIGVHLLIARNGQQLSFES